MKKAGLITEEYVHTFLHKREREVHKGNCGKLLFIGGNREMTGAVILCARSALRSGAGLVQVSVSEELYPVIHATVPEATCISRETKRWDLNSYQAVGIGPGLGDDKEKEGLVKYVAENFFGTVVIDADGLNIVARNRNLIEKKNCRLVLTPHPGEAAKLLHCTTGEINADREIAALKLAQVFDAVVVLKGAGSVVATPLGETYTNTTGNPGMATAGSGDVLTGLITALIGQGLSPETAACCGVYLHGLAGDIGAEQLGEYGLIASDIAFFIAIAIKRTLKRKGKEESGV